MVFRNSTPWNRYFWPKIPPFSSKKLKYTSNLLWKRYICAILGRIWSEKSFKTLQGPPLVRKWLKWPKLAILDQKRPIFSERKAKNFQGYVKIGLKPSLKYTETISWWMESINDVSWPTGGNIYNLLFLDPYIFVYKTQKKRKSTLYLKTSQNFLRL